MLISYVSLIAKQIALSLTNTTFALADQQHFNMDCLKLVSLKDRTRLGVYHSSKMANSYYNSLYIAEEQGGGWKQVAKLSERGSQGYIYKFAVSQSFLVLYELQNQSGNTIAVRMYEDEARLRNNNFMYQYHLERTLDGRNVVNLGTPSFQAFQVISLQPNFSLSQLYLDIKFHYSPDGQHDFPALGRLHLYPLRDFIDSSGKWKGGCLQKYKDWQGKEDKVVLESLRNAGGRGKIGQRDWFEVSVQNQSRRYYLYEVNLQYKFDWLNWRIFLYGDKQQTAQLIPFNISGVLDFANPHVLRTSETELLLSMFLPSEGTAGKGVRAGQMTGWSRVLMEKYQELITP